MKANAAYLEAQLGDQQIAYELSGDILQIALDWTPRVIPLNQIDAIIACSFGYTRDPRTGNLSPGRMNVQLAEFALELWKKKKRSNNGRGVPVFAQWEIAMVLAPDIPDVRWISPETHPENATTKYLSSIGVLNAAKALGAPALGEGQVAIVAWRDHVPRCVELAGRVGLDAGMAPGILPGGRAEDYDPSAGQPWVTNRRAYLLHDMGNRHTFRRKDVVGSLSPSGQTD
jgi:hypothetical protein